MILTVKAWLWAATSECFWHSRGVQLPLETECPSLTSQDGCHAIWRNSWPISVHSFFIYSPLVTAVETHHQQITSKNKRNKRPPPSCHTWHWLFILGLILLSYQKVKLGFSFNIQLLHVGAIDFKSHKVSHDDLQTWEMLDCLDPWISFRLISLCGVTSPSPTQPLLRFVTDRAEETGICVQSRWRKGPAACGWRLLG